MAAQLTEQQMADLAALADGTLSAERRAQVEAWVAASPELAALLEDQRQSLLATQALADEPVPAALTAAIRKQTLARKAQRHRRPVAIALSAAAAVVVLVVAVVALSIGGNPTSPTVADAAALGLRPATGPAPAAVGTQHAQLAAQVGGVAFPDFSAQYGWRAVGIRHGQVGGRAATGVYYANSGRRATYVIVSGSALPRPAGTASTTLHGVRYQTLSMRHRTVVTWRRGGHTCVLIGNATRHELLALASWNGAQAY